MRGEIKGIVVVAIVASAVAAPVASATKTVSPTSYDFGALPIGTKSVERAFTLTATCNPSMDGVVPCMFFENWSVELSTVGDFAIAGDNCPDPPAFLTGDSVMFSRSCTVRVTFTPTAFGPRQGTLLTGSGPSVPLSGSGPALIVTQTIPGPTPTTLPAPPAKKCKKPKKRAAPAAAKKCKKKRKG